MKSGFVTIIGKPNVGKSTLLNQIMGEKFTITSNKPQTTRNRIQCVYNGDEGQIVFIDTPGIHRPEHKLGEYMVKAATSTISDVDLVLFLVEPGSPKELDLSIIKSLSPRNKVILVINKIDSVPGETIIEMVPEYQKLFNFAEIVPVCAFNGRNVDTLLEQVYKYMPEGDPCFPPDMVTDQPERQLAAEFIREKALYVLDKEIPHGIAVVIESFEEREDKDILNINALIVCEKDSHKPIIIGKGGRTLKEIGSQARHELEHFFRIQVNLKIWVKVKPRWRDSEFLVRNFGFDKKDLQ